MPPLPPLRGPSRASGGMAQYKRQGLARLSDLAGLSRQTGDAVQNFAMGATDPLGAAKGAKSLVGFHGSPNASIEAFDRLAPHWRKDKADYLDAIGVWLANSSDEAEMFAKGFNDKGQLARGAVYKVSADVENPKAYESFNGLLDDFNRVNGREQFVGNQSPPGGGARGIAPGGGGDKFRQWLKEAGHDAVEVTQRGGIDRPQESQTYRVVLDPERIKILERLAALGITGDMLSNSIKERKAQPRGNGGW